MLSTRHLATTARPVLPLRVPYHGGMGAALIAVAWPASWLQLGTLGEYSFFPLWLGYILVVDALVLRTKGTSFMTRDPRAFVAMFLASVPLWWAFEGINQLTENWHYVGAGEYSVARYVLVASWNFSVVVPAVFETAELVGCLGWVRRLQAGPRVSLAAPALWSAVGLGTASLVALAWWPEYVYPLTWVSLFLILDPVNRMAGVPSILGYLSRGDWRPVVAVALGALVCGWFWEMWNHWAFPKWEYDIPGVGFARVFEMPLLGYGGYLPFGLEVFAGYSTLAAVAAALRRRLAGGTSLPGGVPDPYWAVEFMSRRR